MIDNKICKKKKKVKKLCFIWKPMICSTTSCEKTNLFRLAIKLSKQTLIFNENHVMGKIVRCLKNMFNIFNINFFLDTFNFFFFFFGAWLALEFKPNWLLFNFFKLWMKQKKYYDIVISTLDRVFFMLKLDVHTINLLNILFLLHFLSSFIETSKES
jgi:hypothetical protein